MVSNINNKKGKEKGKVFSSRRQMNKHSKKKEKKSIVKDPRAKSAEIKLKQRYVLKGVELFIKINKKNKKKRKSKNDFNDNKINNLNNNINKKDNKIKKKKEERIIKLKRKKKIY